MRTRMERTDSAVIADEWGILRGGVGSVLDQCGIGVRGQAATARDAVTLVDGGPCDLVVVGRLGSTSPAEVVRELRRRHPRVRTIVLLEGDRRDEALAAIDAGASVVLSRSATEAELREGIARARRGEAFIAPAILAAVGGPATRRAEDALTDRELSVLGQLVEGRSNQEIASALFIGVATVKTHLTRIYEKLNVQNRVQAVGRAVELRLVP